MFAGERPFIFMEMMSESGNIYFNDNVCVASALRQPASRERCEQEEMNEFLCFGIQQAEGIRLNPALGSECCRMIVCEYKLNQA